MDLEQEIERRMKELTSAMFPRKSFPISHCDLVRKSLREMAAFTRKQTQQAAITCLLENVNPHAERYECVTELREWLQKGEE